MVGYADGMLLAIATLPLLFPQEIQEKQEAPVRDDRTVWEVLADDFDANGDSKFTLEEFGEDQTRFERLDFDGDGEITEEDTLSLGKARPGRKSGMAALPPRPSIRSSRSRRATAPPSAPITASGCRATRNGSTRPAARTAGAIPGARRHPARARRRAPTSAASPAAHPMPATATCG